jgi:hypothetical protein
MHITTMIYSPCSKTSVVPIISRIYDITDIACWLGETICTTFYKVTGFNRFTVSHYGSYSCLPTLKPNLTTSAPRLTTDSLLEIIRLDSHQLYYIRRTDAPTPILIIPKKDLFWSFLSFFRVSKRYLIHVFSRFFTFRFSQTVDITYFPWHCLYFFPEPHGIILHIFCNNLPISCGILHILCNNFHFLSNIVI